MGGAIIWGGPLSRERPYHSSDSDTNGIHVSAQYYSGDPNDRSSLTYQGMTHIYPPHNTIVYPPVQAAQVPAPPPPPPPASLPPQAGAASSQYAYGVGAIQYVYGAAPSGQRGGYYPIYSGW
jgi:hypothetical protein